MRWKTRATVAKVVKIRTNRPNPAKPLLEDALKASQREVRLLRREVERLEARIEVSRQKELKLLSDILTLRRLLKHPEPFENTV